MCATGFWDVETESRGEKCPCHMRESEEKERSSAKGIDCANSRPSKSGMRSATAAQRCWWVTCAKLMRPNPHDTKSAVLVLAWASEKRVEE